MFDKFLKEQLDRQAAEIDRLHSVIKTLEQGIQSRDDRWQSILDPVAFRSFKTYSAAQRNPQRELTEEEAQKLKEHETKIAKERKELENLGIL